MPGAVLFTLAAYLGSSTLLAAPVRTRDLWRVGSWHSYLTGVLTPNFATQYVGHREATPWASLGGLLKPVQKMKSFKVSMLKATHDHHSQKIPKGSQHTEEGKRQTSNKGSGKNNFMK